MDELTDTAVHTQPSITWLAHGASQGSAHLSKFCQHRRDNLKNRQTTTRGKKQNTIKLREKPHGSSARAQTQLLVARKEEGLQGGARRAASAVPKGRALPPEPGTERGTSRVYQQPSTAPPAPLLGSESAVSSSRSNYAPLIAQPEHDGEPGSSRDCPRPRCARAPLSRDGRPARGRRSASASPLQRSPAASRRAANRRAPPRGRASSGQSHPALRRREPMDERALRPPPASSPSQPIVKRTLLRRRTCVRSHRPSANQTSSPSSGALVLSSQSTAGEASRAPVVRRRRSEL